MAVQFGFCPPGVMAPWRFNSGFARLAHLAPWRFITINFHAPALSPPPDEQRVVVEGHAPAGWAPGLSALGHPVVRAPAFDHGAGHAHAIVVRDDHVAGAADPRCRTPAAVVA